MNLKRLAIAIVLAAGVAHAQKFDAASIRRNLTCQGGRNTATPGRATLNCVNMRDTIQEAYGLGGPMTTFRDSAVGGPSWLDTEYYDIAATSDANPPVAEMRGAMMQALLADRLKLQVHRETREVPKYELVAAKGGARLQAATPGACISRGEPVDAGKPAQPKCGTLSLGLGFDMHGVDTDALCIYLSRIVGADVINRTGLTGIFDLRLDISRDDSALVPRVQNMSDQVVDRKGAYADIQRANQGLLIPALQKQLGLDLRPTKGSSEFLVIDHVEKPSEN